MIDYIGGVGGIVSNLIDEYFSGSTCNDMTFDICTVCQCAFENCDI